MIKSKIIFSAMLILGLASCTQQDKGVLLNGKLAGATVDEAVITYSPTGNIFENQMTSAKIDQDGKFSFDTELATETADVTVEMEGGGYFGVHLVKGETVNMNIEKQGDEWKASFDGPQADVCTYVNQYTQLFDDMKYWSPDPSESKPVAEYRKMLEDNYQTLKQSLSGIKEQEQRDYYTRLTDSKYKWLVIRLVMDSCANAGTNYKDNPEYLQLVKGIDINDPISLMTNMGYTALNSLVTAPEDDFEGQSRQMMALSDSLVTNKNLRHFLVQMIGQQYFVYGKGEGNSEQFIKDYLAWAGDDKELAQAQVDQFREQEGSKALVQEGSKAPDAELTTPDGKKVKLSSLLNGKFTYIDVWATWCGPCCKEIPFVEKLVEKYKGNNKVQFLSISIDEDVNAWHKKLENDKPAWPQYIINGEAGEKFSKDWGIQGIPRFIMINPDGTIFSSDATRPSDSKTAETIDQQTK